MKFSVNTSTGWLEKVRVAPSPNCDAFPTGSELELLVIHNISLPPGEFGGDAIEALFQNRLDPAGHPYFEEIAGLKVSAHALIRRDGEVVQFVPFNQRAWHAGVSSYCGRERCNDFSLGIEMEGTDESPYTDAQYLALEAVTAALLSAYPSLSLKRIVGHCDIAPGRKTDPGKAFDWTRYLSAVENQVGDLCRNDPESGRGVYKHPMKL
ncbi:MAG: 1,6-anhydro-N-acetylmuramyl-L-alanine amidase AmpD [bacterium]